MSPKNSNIAWYCLLATNVRKRGTDIRVIRDALDHASLGTTSIHSHLA
jgi:site-specific recombinase XerD